MAREVGASVDAHFWETARSVLLKYCFCQQLNLQLNLLASTQRLKFTPGQTNALVYTTRISILIDPRNAPTPYDQLGASPN